MDAMSSHAPDLIVLVGGPGDGAVIGVPELPHTWRLLGPRLSTREMVRTLAPSDLVPSIEWRFRPRLVDTPDGDRVHARDLDTGAAYYDVQPQT